MANDKWIKMGSLWKRTSKGGKTYLSGVFEKDGVKHEISVWPNDQGDNPKRPNFIIYDNTRDEDRAKPAANNDDGFSFASDASDANEDVPF